MSLLFSLSFFSGAAEPEDCDDDDDDGDDADDNIDACGDPCSFSCKKKQDSHCCGNAS